MDHALFSKQPMFTIRWFIIIAVFCFLVWWVLSNRLRYWSLKQDCDGRLTECTRMMRRYSAVGRVPVRDHADALGAIMRMKSIQHEWWFSTMHGVLLFRREHLGDDFHGLCDRGAAETAGTAAEGGHAQDVLFHRLADVFAFCGVLRLHHFLPVFHHLEREHAGGNLLLRVTRAGHLVCREHGHHLRALSSCRSSVWVSDRRQADLG